MNSITKILATFAPEPSSAEVEIDQALTVEQFYEIHEVLGTPVDRYKAYATRYVFDIRDAKLPLHLRSQGIAFKVALAYAVPLARAGVRILGPYFFRRSGGDTITLGLCGVCGRTLRRSRATIRGAKCHYDGTQYDRTGLRIFEVPKCS